MSTLPVPDNLIEWAQTIGLEQVLTKNDIQSGRSVHSAMQVVVNDFNVQLQTSNTAVSRVNNWNNLMYPYAKFSAQLKNISIKVSQEQKTKIINGNHDIVFQILARLREYHQKNSKQTEVDLSKINSKTQISQSSSLLQLFILGIMKNFNLTSKQSVALLSNDSKYLAHILAKGLKSQFKPVETLLMELGRNLDLISSFCRNKENQLFFIRAIKPSLISKSENVANKGLLLLKNFLQSIPAKKTLLNQFLINTVILGIRRHPYLIAEYTKFMLEVSQYDVYLFQNIKREALDSELQNIFLSMLFESKENHKIDEFYRLRGIDQIVQRSIQNIKDSETAISSLNLLINLVADNPQIISDPNQGNSLINNIQQVTLNKIALNLIFIQQIFTLLSIFGKDKNPLAPNLYKFLLNKFHTTINETQTKAFIHNFKEIVQDFPTIPFHPITEAINARVEQNTIVLTEVEFDFFSFLAKNQNLEANSALIIYNLVSKVLVQEPAFTATCGDIILLLLKKFSMQNIFTDMSIKLIKVCLAIHFANVKKIGGKRKNLSGGSSKIESEDITTKMKNIVIEQFLFKLIEEGIEQINKNAQPLISYSLIHVGHIGKEYELGLRKILSLLGDPNQIVKKYQEEAKKLEEEEALKKVDKKSRLKESSWAANPNNRYSQAPQNKSRNFSSHVNSEEGIIQRPKLLSKYQGGSMHQSFLGVTPAAQRGLEKYQKVYLSKIQKNNKQQQKKKEQEQRDKYLQKVFKQKMLDKGINVKSLKEEEYQYIYDFGSKQRELSKDQNKADLNLAYLEIEEEEERDQKGLEYTMKKYQKVLKLYYNLYNGFHKAKALDNFDRIAENADYLFTKSVWKMLRDHTLDQFISLREVAQIIKMVNYKLDKHFEDMSCLDFQGFETFIIQVSFAMFTRPPKDLRGHPISQMVDELISRFKLYAGDNKINEKIFEDPDSMINNETQALRELNQKLEDNPDYILPEGYKKIVEKKVVFTHRIFLDAMSSNYKDVFEIVNDLLFKVLEVNTIQPFTTYETVAKARPNLYKKYGGGEYRVAKMNVFLKKEVSKIPIKDREIAIQVGELVEEICEAVELGHQKIGLKHENKAIKDQKQTQQQQLKRKKQDQRKWSERNRKIKTAIQKHQQTQKQKKQEQKEKKKAQRKKEQQEKKKQKRQEERLKKKVQQYQDKKKQEEKIRKIQNRENRKKQKEEEERRKKELEETKRKIDQFKQKKKQEEMEKKKKQDEEARKRRIQEKKKYEEEQKRKKQMISQYKLGKSGVQQESKVLDDEKANQQS